MPILELIKAGDVKAPDKVREKGEDESAWVIVEGVTSKDGTVEIDARYVEDDHVFCWGIYSADDELEAER